MDDRKTKMLRDQRDRHVREASQPASRANSPSPSSAEIPGIGHTLSSSDPVVDEPPPYHD